ncbi:uncharacterized protein LOC123684060 [Harmonia axyridis]|uniref:uncharacterized protein LOC123684060 n=1 Tax=Harmonia axyridis TaxID=115357 RepID=UPI001E277E23|nr:uncharacterized protein LOC123684060 [Harmonia axyridis]
MMFHFLIWLPMISSLEAAYASYYGGQGYSSGNRGHGYQWSAYNPVIRDQRSPYSYYNIYPYSRSYLDDYYRYYPQETYPVYYPRTSKYDIYQVLPTYYQKPVSDLSDNYDSYYYGMDPQEFQDEVLQEVQREEREESQPIGHEMLYENEDYAANNFNKYDKASMAYFQKMLAQSHKNTYNNQANKQYMDYLDYDNEWQDIPATRLPPYHQREDKEVQDLKKLKNRNYRNKQNKKKQNEYRHDIHENYKRSNVQNDEITSSVPKTQLKSRDGADKGPVIKVPASTTVQPVSLEPKKIMRGQKEEVMMRPATPVRHPFSAPIMNVVVSNDEWKRSPSVFDTLKRMLEMEKSLKNKYREDLRPPMKKRIVSDEDSLTHQLSVLKKSQ